MARGAPCNRSAILRRMLVFPSLSRLPWPPRNVGSEMRNCWYSNRGEAARREDRAISSSRGISASFILSTVVSCKDDAQFPLSEGCAQVVKMRWQPWRVSHPIVCRDTGLRWPANRSRRHRRCRFCARVRAVGKIPCYRLVDGGAWAGYQGRRHGGAGQPAAGLSKGSLMSRA